MPTDEASNRREAFRQTEVLPMQEELLTPEQLSAEMNISGIVSAHSGLQDLMSNDSGSGHYGSTLSPEISGALETLDQKLDYLINLHMDKDDEQEYGQRLVDMSANGIGFLTQEKCSTGDWLKIKLKLPLFPPLKLNLLGKVVDAVADKGNHGETRIGVSFVYRCEQEEDGIIKYLFKRQRERIRAKHARESIEGAGEY